MTNQNNNDGFNSGTTTDGRFQNQSPDQGMTGSRDAGYQVETQRTVQVEQSEERSATDKVKDNPGKAAGVVGGIAAAAVGAVVAGKSAMNFGKDEEEQKTAQVRTESQVRPAETDTVRTSAPAYTESEVRPVETDSVRTSAPVYTDSTAGTSDRAETFRDSQSYDPQNKDR
jgi:hypothetical protein